MLSRTPIGSTDMAARHTAAIRRSSSVRGSTYGTGSSGRREEAVPMERSASASALVISARYARVSYCQSPSREPKPRRYR